jgi:hypothetical protein
MRELLSGMLAIGLVVSSSSSRVFADAVLDQSFELMNLVSQGGVGSSLRANTAQTVKFGITGQLTRVDFWAFSTATGIGDLIVDIRATEPDGSPAEDDLSVLAQVTVPRASVVSNDNLGPSPVDVDPLLISVDLMPFNLHFQAGDRLAINFSGTESPNETVAYAILGNFGAAGTNLPYENGAAYLRVSDLMDGEFFAWTFNDQGARSVDLGFRTFVLPVPEPSTIGLTGYVLALGTFSAGRRRAKVMTNLAGLSADDC